MSRNGHYSLDPASLMQAIEADARALDKASKELHDAIRQLAEAEQKYERELQGALIALHDEAKAQEGRPPAEDIRRALAHKRIDSKVYGDYLMAKARVEGGRAWCRARESSLSARQSLLRVLSEEARVS